MLFRILFIIQFLYPHFFFWVRKIRLETSYDHMLDRHPTNTSTLHNPWSQVYLFNDFGIGYIFITGTVESGQFDNGRLLASHL